MTTAALTTERPTEAVGHLIDQFKGQPNIAAFIQAWAQQSQELEIAAFVLLAATTISSAFGVQLDGLGAIVGVERAGRTDADYRVRIAAQILRNNASGTIEELLQLGVALGATSLELVEVQPAKIQLTAGIDVVNGAEIAQVMAAAKPAGVRMWFVWYEDGTPFRFDDAQGLDQGELAEVVSS